MNVSDHWDTNCYFSSSQLVGFIACLERFLADADERGNAFLLHMLEKQHTRLKGLFDRHVVRAISRLHLIGNDIYPHRFDVTHRMSK